MTFHTGNSDDPITTGSGPNRFVAGSTVGPSGTPAVLLGSSTDGIYCPSSGITKTDGKFVAATGLGVGNAATAATLGTVVKKIQVFDAAGVSLGYVAVYDAITA